MQEKSKLLVAIEQQLMHISRETGSRAPALALKVVGIEPLRMQDEDGLQLEMKTNFDSLLTSFLDSVKVGLLLQFKVWGLQLGFGDSKVESLTICVDELVVINPGKKSRTVQKDCNMLLEVFPKLKLSDKAMWWLSILSKKRARQVNPAVPGPEPFLQPSQGKAQPQPAQSKSRFNLTDLQSKLVERLCSQVTRGQLFSLLSRHEKEAVGELRRLTLQNEGGRKMSFSREAVCGLQSAMRRGR